MKNYFTRLGKALLISVSLISIAFGLNSAFAVTRVTNSNTDITNGTGFTPNGFDNGDNLTFGDNHTVTFSSNLSPTINIVDFADFNGIIYVNSGINITANDIKSGTIPVGTIHFVGDSTANINISTVPYINEILLGNGTLSITGVNLRPDHINLDFGSILKFSGPSVMDVRTTTGINNISGNDLVGSAVIDTDITYHGSIGDAQNRLQEVVFTSDSVFTFVNNNGSFIQALDIYPDANLGSGNGSLHAFYSIAEKDIEYNIGKSDAKVKLFAISSDPASEQGGPPAIVTNIKNGAKIYANRVDIYPYNKNNLQLNQSTLNIESNTIVDGLIGVTPPGLSNNVGIINILGNSTLTGGIGESTKLVQSVNFNSLDSSDIVLFTGDIYTHLIEQKSPNLKLTQDTLFYVNDNNGYHSNNSTNSLDLNTWTISGSGSMTGTAVFNIRANETKAGHLEISRRTFSLGGQNGVDSMTLNLVDLTTTLPPSQGRSYTIFGITNNEGNIIIPDDGIVNFNVVSSSNPFVQWTYGNGIITQTPLPQVPEIIIDSVQTNDQVTAQNLNIIANSDSGARSDLVNAIITSDPQELLDRLVIVITEVTEDSFNTIEDIIGDVSANLDKKSGLLTTFVAENSELSGISAGDAANRYGAWASYSISSNTQSKKGTRPGYKSKSNGVTIGADTLINDETAIGFAVGYIHTKVDHKDSNLGDKSSVKSILLSLYSVTEFLNNWYIQAQAIFGQNKIHNTELRGTVTSREYAKASFKSKVYAGSIEAGYHHFMKNNTLLTPIVGLEYDVIDKSAYKEYGTVNQNLTVKKSPQRKLIGHVGLSVSKNVKFADYELIPEVYGIIRHDFINKNLKVSSKLDGVEDSLVTRTAQNTPTFYNIGLGLTSLIKQSEVTLGYDYYVGEKYYSHQGSIKVRVNF